jgi:hypothetical protein
MKIDRKLQKKILEFLKKYYPSQIEISAFIKKRILNHKTKKIFPFNMFYLEEHGLINLETGTTPINMPPEIQSARITNEGIDFLENDGGLSTILNTITIKFDIENIRKLLSEEILKSTLKPKTKDKLIDTIKNVPADILKIIYTNFVNSILTHVPGVYHQAQM